MSFLRCFSTLGCPTVDLEGAHALAAAHQVDGVELRALGGTVDLPAYFSHRFRSPGELRSRMEELGLRVIALGASLRLADATGADRDTLLAWVPWAEALGAPWVRVFDGGKHADAGEMERATATLAWWQAVRRERGWRAELMIETHDSLLTAAAIRRLVAAAPGVAILWDSHHTWRKGGEDPLATWSAIKHAVVHVHAKDSVAGTGAEESYVYVPPGEGQFPFRGLMERLRTEGFGGAVSIEWERLWLPQLGPLGPVLTAASQCGW